MVQLSLFESFFKERSEFNNPELTLKRINNALKAVQPTHADTQVMHVTGTNGKGSTSLFLSHLLAGKGYSTLLFTSPHITNIRERIQYNNNPIPEDVFDSLFKDAEKYIIKEELSFFESIFFMAMLLNKAVMPDFLILETGLGGRYDATNTDAVEQKIPVITTMGQDHENLLGHKISGILKEKIAIAGDNNPVFVGYNPDFIVKMIKDLLPLSDIRYVNLEKLFEVENLYPAPFYYNYLNAHQVAEYILGERLNFQKLPLPPCRHEVIGRVILDGAHNVPGLISLLKSFAEMPECAIVSSTSDRDLAKFCAILSKRVKKIILTVIPDNDRSYSLSQLKKFGYDVAEHPYTALENALKTYSGGVLVTGSLYLCASVRGHLLSGRGGGNG